MGPGWADPALQPEAALRRGVCGRSLRVRPAGGLNDPIVWREARAAVGDVRSPLGLVVQVLPAPFRGRGAQSGAGTGA